MSAESISKELEPKAFAEKLGTVATHAGLSMSLAIANNVGLFNAMAKLENPETSEKIAQVAGLVERYVRELLGVFVTSNIVHYCKENKTYFLPRNYIPFLTTGSKNMTPLCNLMLLVSTSKDELEACFKNGGGIPYSSFKGFHAWMDDFSSKRHHATMLDQFVPSVEGLKEKLESGIKCLDIGCGSGSPSLLLAAAFPKSEFYGFDFSEQAIGKANERAKMQNLTNVSFQVQDCAKITGDYENFFDYVTAFDTIHDQAYPAKALSEAFRVLKKDGIFSLVDIDAHSDVGDNIKVPMASLKYAISLFHCMPVSLYFEGGAGLGVCWGKELAMKMLAEAGFRDSKCLEVSNDMFNAHILSRK